MFTTTYTRPFRSWQSLCYSEAYAKVITFIIAVDTTKATELDRSQMENVLGHIWKGYRLLEDMRLGKQNTVD